MSPGALLEKHKRYRTNVLHAVILPLSQALNATPTRKALDKCETRAKLYISYEL